MANFGNNGVAGATGVYKTTDAGVTWFNTTGSITTSIPYTDVKVDPNTPATVYMAIGRVFGSTSNGVYKSTNAGGAWTRLSNAPLGSAAGRISIAVSKSNSQILYVAAHDPATDGLYKMMRSDDGGSTFTDLTAGTPNFVGDQGWYDICVAVDPANPAIVYAGGSAGISSIIRSVDSGVTWTNIAVGSTLNPVAPHADHHALVFDAGGLLLDGDDGGIFRLDNSSGPSWSDLNGNLETIPAIRTKPSAAARTTGQKFIPEVWSGIEPEAATADSRNSAPLSVRAPIMSPPPRARIRWAFSSVPIPAAAPGPASRPAS
jgi:hypothetical protein